VPDGTHPAEVGSSGIALSMLVWVLVAYFLLVYAVWLGARLIELMSTVAAACGAVLGVGCAAWLPRRTCKGVDFSSRVSE
jgi:hypothetical protein